MTAIRKSPVLLVFFFALAGMMFSLGAYAKGPGPGPGDELTVHETEYLWFMREEEKLARDTYTYFYEQWDLPVFENIAASEQRHTDAIEKLIVVYGLWDPVDDESIWKETNLFNFANGEDGKEDLNALIRYLVFDEDVGGLTTVEQAALIGELIEEKDILDIQHAIDVTAAHPDIVAVYESLMCGSRNHLRAFYTQLQILGIVDQYVSILPPEFFETSEYEDFDDLATSPVERDCGGDHKGQDH